MKKKIIGVILALTSVLCLSSAVSAEEASYVRNMLGRSNAAVFDKTEGIGWERVSVKWSQTEPSRGQINRSVIADLKDKIKVITESGKQVVLLLEEPPQWAVEGGAYSFERDGEVYQVSRNIGVRYGKVVKHIFDIDNAELKEVMLTTKQMPIADKNIDAWKQFVSMCAEEFSGLGVEYVQIYAQPFGKVSDYYQNPVDYMNKIHIPTAEILKQRGFSIVSGGVSTGFGVTRLIELLDQTKGWDYIDVLSLNYNTVGAVNYLYEQARERGINDPSIWMSEVGYENTGVYIPNFYPRMIYWALSHQAENKPDQFKIFWSETDEKGNSIPLKREAELTVYGKEIAAIDRLLSGKTISFYKDYDFTPGMNYHMFDNMSSTEGFLIDGERAVIAAHFLKQNTAAIYSSDDGDSLHLNFSNSFVYMNAGGVPEGAAVRRVTALGDAWEANHEWKDGKCFISVSIPDKLSAPPTMITETAEAIAVNSGFMTTFFVELDAKGLTE